MAFVGVLSQIKQLFWPLVIQLVWYILIQLFTSVSVKVVDINRGIQSMDLIIDDNRYQSIPININ